MSKPTNSGSPVPLGAPLARQDNKVLDVTVVLLEDGYASTAIGPIEVFHSAGLLWNWLHGDTPNPRFRVRIASIDGKSVSSLCGLGLTPEVSIHDIEHTDIIILPASGWDVMDRIAQNTALLPWIRKWYANGAYIAGVCTGVVFIAECGLLDGREATTHWGLAAQLQQRYPKVHWRPERFVTEDGRLLCSGGVYASMDISLYLVEKFCGHEIALQCAKSLLQHAAQPAIRVFGLAVVASAFGRQNSRDGRISAGKSRSTAVDRTAGRPDRNGAAQFHSPVQGRDRSRARRLYPDAACCRSKRDA